MPQEELEKILWSISDKRPSKDECLDALPSTEEVNNDEISVIIGFAAMSMSTIILEAAIEKYKLSTTEFNIDLKYNGRTAFQWLNSRLKQGSPDAKPMLDMLEQLPSFKVSIDCTETLRKPC